MSAGLIESEKAMDEYKEDYKDGDLEIKYNTKEEIISLLSSLDFIQGRIDTSSIPWL